MRRGRIHLTYCSNIHPGESWSEVAAALADSLPQVRAHLKVAGPFAVGLRLSAAAARDLEDPEALQRFVAFLHDGDYYVPTINGFPYGAFHGTRVKERVYLPDWRSQERLDYTNRLAAILVRLASARGLSTASISTVPGAFRSSVKSADDVRTMTERMLAHAAFLTRLRRETGVTVALAIEPEPACYVETTQEAIVFFRDWLFAPSRIAAAAAATGIGLAKDDVARHVGVCLDACHMAVEFEDAEAAVNAITEAGIRLCKVQVSSALRLSRVSGDRRPQQLLGGFAEDTYLHQVVSASARGLARFDDLPDALGAAQQTEGEREEWRVHFHVPVFLDRMAGFDTTQSYLASLLDTVKRRSACDCFEVETYTWDVLPPEYRTTDVCTAIARELAWAQSVLDG